MFGTNHEKLSKKEVENGYHNAKLMNQQAMVAFKKKLEDMERIHEKGPAIHADELLVRECINYVMREMIADDLESRIKHKLNRN